MVSVVTPPTGKPASCRECGAGLSYMPSDVRNGESTDYGGGREFYKYILCPCCGHQITVRG